MARVINRVIPRTAVDLIRQMVDEPSQAREAKAGTRARSEWPVRSAALLLPITEPAVQAFLSPGAPGAAPPAADGSDGASAG